jgi:hypothetical protein
MLLYSAGPVILFGSDSRICLLPTIAHSEVGACCSTVQDLCLNPLRKLTIYDPLRIGLKA